MIESFAQAQLPNSTGIGYKHELRLITSSKPLQDILHSSAELRTLTFERFPQCAFSELVLNASWSTKHFEFFCWPSCFNEWVVVFLFQPDLQDLVCWRIQRPSL